jgi:NAD-reducing hydrogenase small subunit
MSLLDTDERLVALAEHVTVVWGPLVDAKEFPENVDVTLVEGAISSEEDLHRIRLVRARTKILVSLGDCAVTGNVRPCATTSAPTPCCGAPTWRTPRWTRRFRAR